MKSLGRRVASDKVEPFVTHIPRSQGGGQELLAAQFEYPL